jgi:hypothetical protein
MDIQSQKSYGHEGLDGDLPKSDLKKLEFLNASVISNMASAILNEQIAIESSELPHSNFFAEHEVLNVSTEKDKTKQATSGVLIESVELRTESEENAEELPHLWMKTRSTDQSVTYRYCNELNPVEVSLRLYPAIEWSFTRDDKLNAIEKIPLEALDKYKDFYAKLGITYYRESDNIFLTLPLIEQLKINWAELKKEHPEILDIEFTESEGIASNETFIEIFLAGKILISKDKELVHDYQIHVISQLYDIFYEYEHKEDRKDYLDTFLDFCNKKYEIQINSTNNLILDCNQLIEKINLLEESSWIKQNLVLRVMGIKGQRCLNQYLASIFYDPKRLKLLSDQEKQMYSLFIGFYIDTTTARYSGNGSIDCIDIKELFSYIREPEYFNYIKSLSPYMDDDKKLNEFILSILIKIFPDRPFDLLYTIVKYPNIRLENIELESNSIGISNMHFAYFNSEVMTKNKNELYKKIKNLGLSEVKLIFNGTCSMHCPFFGIEEIINDLLNEGIDVVLDFQSLFFDEYLVEDNIDTIKEIVKQFKNNPRVKIQQPIL